MTALARLAGDLADILAMGAAGASGLLLLGQALWEMTTKGGLVTSAHSSPDASLAAWNLVAFLACVSYAGLRGLQLRGRQ